jgi:hypothetical protein
MFENYTNWTISSEAPVGWRTFTDYSREEKYIYRNIFGNSGYFYINLSSYQLFYYICKMITKTIKIYTLSHPITKEIRYIGKTISILKYRLSGHISEAKRGENISYKNSWIMSLLKQGLIPVIELLDEINEEKEWEWIEQYWISQFKCWEFNLINMTDGGDGNKNQKWTDRRRLNFSNTMKRKIKSGEIDYSIRAAKISESHKGKKLSEATKEKIRKINLGKKYSIETIIKKSKGGIEQYDLNNKLINTFLTLTEASEKTGFFRGNISSACTGRLKTYKGFIWKYKSKDIVDA